MATVIEVATDNVPPDTVRRNTATIVASADAAAEIAAPGGVGLPADGIRELRARGATLHSLTHARDLRGSLAAVEFDALPFVPARIFAVYDVPSESVRGAHAHRVCSQFLICIAGTVRCRVDDGSAHDEVTLEAPNVGLHIPPMTWATQWRYSPDAVLLVLASHPYDAADYIRQYDEFLRCAARREVSGAKV